MTQPLGDEVLTSDATETSASTPSTSTVAPATRSELDTVSGVLGGGWGEFPN